MTQEEIDALIKTLEYGEIEDPVDSIYHSSLNPVECKNKYSAIVTAKARYDYALVNSSIEDIEEERRNLHRLAFSNWLLRKEMSRDEYYKLMNREAAKKGMQPPFEIN